MFGYNYSIGKNDKGNKILNISVSLDYLAMMSNFKDEITTVEIENILELHNPIGILRDEIDGIYKKDYR